MLLVRAALLGPLIHVHRLDDFVPCHERFGQARGHGRGDAKALVNADLVVPDRIDHEHVSKIIDEAAKSILLQRAQGVLPLLHRT